MKKKYIITKDKDIIVFPAETGMLHVQFQMFKPISAGFISFYVSDDGKPQCYCYGESVGLGLKSNPDRDTKIAMEQLFGDEY